MPEPVIGQAVRGCSMVGQNFKGTIASLEEPIRGIPSVRVQVKDEQVRCFWFDSDPREAEIPAALWASCWPEGGPDA